MSVILLIVAAKTTLARTMSIIFLVLAIGLLTFLKASQLTIGFVLRPLSLHELCHLLDSRSAQVVADCLESHTVWLGKRHKVPLYFLDGIRWSQQAFWRHHTGVVHLVPTVHMRYVILK